MPVKNTKSEDTCPEWVIRQHDQLENSSLGNITLELLKGLRPLAPVAAQILWLAQPAFSILGRSREIGELAEWLESPPQDP